ncbi:Chromosome partition protein Smc [uncultured archaeon]|nr:Chromosome partition protein Smc [uncultured archaeon]
MADANNKIDAAKARILSLQNEIDRLAADKDAVNREIMASGEGKQLDLQKEIDSLTLEIERAKAIIESRAEGLAKGQGRLKEIQGELTKTEDEVKGYARQLGENSTELETLQKMLAEAQAEYQKLMEAKDKFSSKFYDMQHVVHECEERQLKIKEELSNLQAEVSKNTEIKRFKENELDKLARGAFGTDEIDEKRHTLDERKKTAKEEGKAAQKQIDAKFAREKNVNERIAVLDDLLIATREKVVMINSRLKHAGGEQSTTKSQDVMDAFAKTNKGVRGRLENIVKHEPQYAVPIQVALGARASFYVVDSVRTASEAINTLKNSKTGRVSFIPLDKIKAPKVPDEYDKAVKADGCLGPLTDYVEYSEGISTAIRYALGDTLLFQGLASAEKWVGKGVRIVTMDGSLVEASGLMTGGTASAKINAAMERQSLAEWEAKLEEFKHEKDGLMAELYQIREEMGTLRKEKAKTDLAERSVEIELEQLKKQEDTLLAAKDNLSATVKALKKEVRELDDATSKADEGRATLVRELSELNVKLLEAKGAIDVEKQEQYGTLVTQKERRISELRVSIAEYENARRSLETQREVYGKQADSLRRQLEQVQQETSESDKLTKDNQALIKDRQKLLKAKVEEQKSISGALKKLIDSRSEFDAKIAQTANERGKIEFEKEKIERGLGDKAVRRAVLEDKLSSLKAEFGNYPNATPLQNKTEDDKPALLVKARELDGALSQLGNVNLKAVDLFEQKTKELEEHRKKVDQIANEKQAVIMVIEEIERKKIATFMEAYNHINENFKRLFKQVFSGNGSLFLENPENPFEGGLTIEVKLENKEVKYLELMSGGEKSLVALMFLFALQAFNPSSIYILDEADAALDAENSRKLGLLVKEISKDSQMLMVSHNQNVYSTVDCIIGVAMGKDGSQLVEVKIDKSKETGQKHLTLSDKPSAQAVPVSIAPSAPNETTLE